jgi:N-acetyl-gamma-glutamyl-phosphate reductase
MGSKISVGVIGASGYSGGELLRMLTQHPHFNPSYIAAGSSAGELITSIHPHLTAYAGKAFASTAIEEASTCDLLFVALPHGESAKIVNQLPNSIKIVDLGADFRLKNAASWAKYYGGDHAGTWTYGIADMKQQVSKIAESSRVANPGCYATTIILATAPALDAIDATDITVVAASGTTGAGRNAKINLIGSEVMNSLTSYKFGGAHQHTPEVEETLSGIKSGDVKISFTPILAPMPRGILTTVTAKLTQSITQEEIRVLYESAYAHTPFVTLLPYGHMPKTSSLTGSNSVHLQVAIDDHTNRLVVSAAEDNLGKGAAGQAIQNANIMCGFAPELGLSVIGVGA